MSGRTRIIAALSSAAALFGLFYIAGATGAGGAAAGGLAMLLLIGWLGRGFARDLAAAQRETVRRLQQQRRSDAPLRARIVEGVTDPLLLLDPGKEVVDANRPARMLLGERILGREVALFLRHPRALDAIEGALRHGTPHSAEIALPVDGERTYSVTATRIGNNAGSGGPASYVVVSLHDITQMKIVERMRADFVANASHELRTPLSALIGFIETLQGPAREDPEAAERFLAIMHEEADRMVRLIDDLLSLSRIERDRHVLPDRPVELPGLLESVALSLQPAAEERGMTIAVEAEAGLPPVRGDRDQLVQVLQNLVSNAIKYARPETTVRIVAGPIERIPGSGRPGVRFAVIDRGEGIAPEHLPRLTERFYRVDAARSRKLGGTGLGLAIVKHIVNRHRGQLEIRSTPGEGTAVSVSLPRYEPEAPQPT